MGSKIKFYSFLSGCFLQRIQSLVKKAGGTRQQLRFSSGNAEDVAESACKTSSHRRCGIREMDIVSSAERKSVDRERTRDEGRLATGALVYCAELQIRDTQEGETKGAARTLSLTWIRSEIM